MSIILEFSRFPPSLPSSLRNWTLEEWLVRRSCTGLSVITDWPAMTNYSEHVTNLLVPIFTIVGFAEASQLVLVGFVQSDTGPHLDWGGEGRSLSPQFVINIYIFIWQDQKDNSCDIGIKYSWDADFSYKSTSKCSQTQMWLRDRLAELLLELLLHLQINSKFSSLWSTSPTTHNLKHEDHVPWEIVRDHNKFEICSPQSLEYKLAPRLSIYCLSLGVWDEFESWLLNIRGNCPVKYSII